MQKSPIQSTESSKTFHQESTSAKPWWHINSVVSKTLSYFSLIHRNSYDVTIYNWYNNISSVIFKPLMQLGISELSGLSSNKRINVDVSLRCASLHTSYARRYKSK